MHLNFEQNNSEFKIRELLIRPTPLLGSPVSQLQNCATHMYVQVYKT